MQKNYRKQRGGGRKRSFLKAFILAEVLITLGVIVIITAITIPTLISNYQDRAWQTSSEVFVRRLEEALNLLGFR